MGPNLKAVKVVVSVGKCKNANNGWSFEADSTNYDSLEGWNIIMEFLHFDTFSDFFVFLLVCWFVSLLLFFFCFVFRIAKKSNDGPKSKPTPNHTS